MSRPRTERLEIGQRRIIRILRDHGIAISRTLEQKISDAGPFDQRIDPHILTEARKGLQKAGRLLTQTHLNAPWYYLSETPRPVLDSRLAEQSSILQPLSSQDMGIRIGQTLEIAIFRALQQQQTLTFLGDFPDLDKHDDSRPYSKEEPPSALSGRRAPNNRKLDFLIQHPQAGWAGLEAKNVREWLYPDREEIRDLLAKCVSLDCVPILICRRFPFVTFKIFSACGVIFHQNYNQLFPFSETRIAEQAKHKRYLGFHDIRIGNEPDQRLQKFVSINLPKVLPAARVNFDSSKSLLEQYVRRSISYKAFVASVSPQELEFDEDTHFGERDQE